MKSSVDYLLAGHELAQTTTHSDSLYQVVVKFLVAKGQLFRFPEFMAFKDSVLAKFKIAGATKPSPQSAPQKHSFCAATNQHKTQSMPITPFEVHAGSQPHLPSNSPKYQASQTSQACQTSRTRPSHELQPLAIGDHKALTTNDLETTITLSPEGSGSN